MVGLSFKNNYFAESLKRFRGGLVFKAHRLVNHSTLGWRVIKKKKKGLSMILMRCVPAILLREQVLY